MLAGLLQDFGEFESPHANNTSKINLRKKAVSEHYRFKCALTVLLNEQYRTVEQIYDMTSKVFTTMSRHILTVSNQLLEEHSALAQTC